MTTKLEDLKLMPWLLAELHQLGYETVEDLKDVPAAELLRMPGMGGATWRKICKALGRDPFPNPKKRR